MPTPLWSDGIRYGVSRQLATTSVSLIPAFTVTLSVPRCRASLLRLLLAPSRTNGVANAVRQARHDETPPGHAAAAPAKLTDGLITGHVTAMRQKVHVSSLERRRTDYPTKVDKETGTAARSRMGTRT